ncbi:MAG: hypothetical protein ACLFUF_08495 [Opitutales bacterium]
MTKLHSTIEGVPGASFELNREPAFIREAGITRYFDNGWHASAGYALAP